MIASLRMLPSCTTRERRSVNQTEFIQTKIRQQLYASGTKIKRQLHSSDQLTHVVHTYQPFLKVCILCKVTYFYLCVSYCVWLNFLLCVSHSPGPLDLPETGPPIHVCTLIKSSLYMVYLVSLILGCIDMFWIVCPNFEFKKNIVVNTVKKLKFLKLEAQLVSHNVVKQIITLNIKILKHFVNPNTPYNIYNAFTKIINYGNP